MSLFHRLLQLPEETNLITPEQRASYQSFLAILPPLPLQPDGQHYAPAQVVSSGSHNAEVPELFAVHPFRLLTVGRPAVDPDVNLTVARNTWYSLPLAQANTGWYYGGMDAALLGLANESYSMILSRSTLQPPPNYRFPTFAPHLQDYPPSADHYANFQTALHFSLLQSGEDEPVGSLVVLPSWPCENDVSFKLWGTLNTTVEVVYQGGGTLVSLDVEPPARASAIKWAACVTEEDGRRAVERVLARSH